MGLTTLEIDVTLRDLRDETLHAKIAEYCPEIDLPLNITGTCVIMPELKVEDREDVGRDDRYCFGFHGISLTPETTSWDVIRRFAIAWAKYPLMDDFTLLHFHLPDDLIPPPRIDILLFAWIEDLPEPDALFAGLPFPDDDDD
jgi:hypothetical protein